MSCYEIFQTLSVCIVSIQLVFGVFRWIYENIIGPHFLESTNFRQYGKWALVTGATDGIGKQYARSLAKRGLNIILVSRTLSKLENVAKEISESFNVETQVIAVNFTSGPEIYDEIKKEIEGKEIGILVNNVGMAYAAPDYFLNIPNREQFIQDIIRCNVTSVPMMCSLILPQMVHRKHGLIINISSVASVAPCPTMPLYSASKAFVSKFSVDLEAEYRPHGITVQVLITGDVSTNMNKLKKFKFMKPSPSDYVESSLHYVGYARYTSGFFVHSLICTGIRLINFISPSFLEGRLENMALNYRDAEIQKGNYKPVT